MRLYRVTIECELIVYAADETAAQQIALDNVGEEEESSIDVREIKSRRDLNGDEAEQLAWQKRYADGDIVVGEWLDAHPGGVSK